MVKMTHALSNPVRIVSSSKHFCIDKSSKIFLPEKLQTDPVKRLLNQPNIIISSSLVTESNKDIENKKNGMNVTLNNIKPPEISIVPVKIPDEEKEDANLLPSKIEDKKSEIALLPVKKKLCGHYEPCESIVCDVTVQQYVDKDGVSPMLAVNIEEDEINAPVAKHCKNERCDALSIDHNRCRRALIKLRRCDKSRMCDICGIILKVLKSRIYHRNCTRKHEYTHNDVDRMDLQRQRMRERILQMNESAKMKKNDYSDPVKAMETLRKNNEIIIIPKAAPSQQPIVTITSMSGTQPFVANLSNSHLSGQSMKINPQGNNLANLFRNMPFTVSSQNTSITGNASRSIENKTQSMNQVKLPNLQQNPCASSTSTPVTTSAFASVASPQNRYVSLSVPATPMVNNWVVSASPVLTTTQIQPKPQFFTPIRVVPITNLITAPSLLHRTQGIPKFCIMTENLVRPVTPITPVTVPNLSPFQPTAAATADAGMQQEATSKIPIQRDTTVQRLRKANKLLKAKKTFFCIYCSKHFSTDWYFKMHVAKHKGEKLFFCNLCDDSFCNKYDMKKHMNKKHNGQKELARDKRDYVCKSSPLKSHVETHATPGPDETNVKLKKQKLQFAEDKKQTTIVSDSIDRDGKKIKCEDNANEKKEISSASPKSQNVRVIKTYATLSPGKTKIRLKKQNLQVSDDEIKCMTSVNDSIDRNEKKIECEDNISEKKILSVSLRSHVKTYVTPSTNEAKIKLKKQKLQFSEDETKRTTSISDSIDRDGKKIKCEDTSDNTNEKKEIAVNGKTMQDDVEYLKNTCVEEHNSEESLTINRDDDAKTIGSIFVPS